MVLKERQLNKRKQTIVDKNKVCIIKLYNLIYPSEYPSENIIVTTTFASSAKSGDIVKVTPMSKKEPPIMINNPTRKGILVDGALGKDITDFVQYIKTESQINGKSVKNISSHVSLWFGIIVIDAKLQNPINTPANKAR